MIVQELSPLLVDNPETGMPHYPHQVVMLDEWERHNTFRLKKTDKLEVFFEQKDIYV